MLWTEGEGQEEAIEKHGVALRRLKQDCREFKPSSIVTSCLLETQEQGLGRVFTEHFPGGPLSRRMNTWLRFPCSQSKKAEPPIVAHGVYNLKQTGYICSMCYCEGLKWEFCPCRIPCMSLCLRKTASRAVHPAQGGYPCPFSSSVQGEDVQSFSHQEPHSWWGFPVVNLDPARSWIRYSSKRIQSFALLFEPSLSQDLKSDSTSQALSSPKLSHPGDHLSHCGFNMSSQSMIHA